MALAARQAVITEAPQADLAAIERIMTALYQSISGTDDSERDWDLSKSLFHLTHASPPTPSRTGYAAS